MTTHLTLPTNFNKDNKFDKNIFRKIVKKILESNVSHAHGLVFSRKENEIKSAKNKKLMNKTKQTNKQTKVKLSIPGTAIGDFLCRKNQNKKL